MGKMLVISIAPLRSLVDQPDCPNDNVPFNVSLCRRGEGEARPRQRTPLGAGRSRRTERGRGQDESESTAGRRQNESEKHGRDTEGQNRSENTEDTWEATKAPESRRLSMVSRGTAALHSRPPGAGRGQNLRGPGGLLSGQGGYKWLATGFISGLSGLHLGL